METKPVNIYYQDAISQGLWIIKVGKAYVAKQGVDRLRVFWHGTETQNAITALEAWMVAHSHKVPDDLVIPQSDADSVTTQHEGGQHAQK